MSASIDQSLRRELGRDERLLWSGAPEQGVRLRPSDALAIPFSLLWGGFAFFWEYSVLQKGAPLLFGLWGVPFVLVGLYMIVGRFFGDAYLRSRTQYGVTDQRVIIVSGWINREVKNLPLASMSDITLSERPNGEGSIQFGPNPFGVPMMFGSAMPGSGKRMPPMFDLLPKVRDVYSVIMKAKQDLKGTASGERE
jgi:hypothetical protein